MAHLQDNQTLLYQHWDERLGDSTSFSKIALQVKTEVWGLLQVTVARFRYLLTRFQLSSKPSNYLLLITAQQTPLFVVKEVNWMITVLGSLECNRRIWELMLAFSWVIGLSLWRCVEIASVKNRKQSVATSTSDSCVYAWVAKLQIKPKQKEET